MAIRAPAFTVTCRIPVRSDPRLARFLPGVPGPAPVPTAIDVFGGETVPFPKPPGQLAERYFTIASWGEHGRGGHFPAVAEPKAPSLQAQRLRETLRPCRPPAQPGS